MPRVARIVVPGLPHHITQRGNDRQVVFQSDADRAAYLAILRQEISRRRVSVLGWCLMPNHVHLIAVPPEPGSLASAIGRTHWLYARYFNQSRARSGHLWQNRFYSSAVARDHLGAVAKYVDLNPVRAGLCASALDWTWSSVAAHCSGRDSDGLLNLRAWRKYLGEADWSRSIGSNQDEGALRFIREQSMTGRPIAAAKDVRRMERDLGVSIVPMAVGRPRRAPGGSTG